MRNEAIKGSFTAKRINKAGVVDFEKEVKLILDKKGNLELIRI